MAAAIDLTGRRFGRLTAIKSAPKPSDAKFNGLVWLCECDCGNFKAVRSNHLTRERFTQSCGCFKLDYQNRSHGHNRRNYRSPTHRSWATMLNRCRNTKTPDYELYGARGIKVCDRWETFENFLMDMGERPEGLSLDRINNDGNYEPGNCKWSNASEQAFNRRPKRKVAS